MSERTYIFSEKQFRKFLFQLMEAREDDGLDDPRTVDFAEKLAVRMNCCAPRAALSGSTAPVVMTAPRPVQRVNLTTATKAAPAPAPDKPKAPAAPPAPAPRKPEPVADPLALTKKGLI